MTTSAARASAFYDEVLMHREVWSVRDGDGIPAPETEDGRSMPFWSLRSRAERVVASVAAYESFDVVAIPLDDWRSRWLPGLEKDGISVGLNWSGTAATGFDVPPNDVASNLAVRESRAEP